MFKKKEKEGSEQINDKLMAKFEKMGYSKEIIKLALGRCPAPNKESSMIETLKLVTQETRIATNQGQIDQANQKFISNAYKKYGELGYDRDAIKAALTQCQNIYNDNAMVDALNRIIYDRNTSSQTQINQKFINNAFKKYEELGYDRQIINKALAKCPNVYNENMMIDTLNMLTKERSYPRVY